MPCSLKGRKGQHFLDSAVIGRKAGHDSILGSDQDASEVFFGEPRFWVRKTKTEVTCESESKI